MISRRWLAQRILRAAGDDARRELGREEALELGEALQLGHLFRDAALEIPVECRQFARLVLHRVVEALDAQQRPHPRHQLLLVDRFGEEVIGARLQSLDALFVRIERGDHDHGQYLRLMPSADRSAHLIAVHFRHDHVEQHEVGGVVVDLLQCFATGGGAGNLVALNTQRIGQQFHVHWQVIDDQEPGGCLHVQESRWPNRSRVV